MKKLCPICHPDKAHLRKPKIKKDVQPKAGFSFYSGIISSVDVIDSKKIIATPDVIVNPPPLISIDEIIIETKNKSPMKEEIKKEDTKDPFIKFGEFKITGLEEIANWIVGPSWMFGKK